MDRIAVDSLGLLAYCLLCALLYLAGMSFGGPLEFLFYAAAALFFLCTAVFIANCFALRFVESFSTEHPVKGEKIDYTLGIANESRVPLPRLRLSFRRPSAAQEHFPDEYHYLGRGGSIEERKTVSCRVRGIYEVGIDRASIADLFGFFRFYPSVFFRTFYVYPRLVELERLGFEDSPEAPEQGARRGLCELREEFDFVDEYRRGDSMKDICWKRFFVTGSPSVKRYEHSARRMAELHADLRPAGTLDPRGEEDLTLEILLALQKYFLSKGILFRSYGGCRPLVDSAAGVEGLRRFYESTIFLRFDETMPLSESVRSAGGGAASGALVLITHIVDYSTIELLEGGGILLFNSAGKTDRELEEVRRFGDAARRKGVFFRDISSADAIAGALS